MAEHDTPAASSSQAGKTNSALVSDRWRRPRRDNANELPLLDQDDRDATDRLAQLEDEILDRARRGQQ